MSEMIGKAILTVSTTAMTKDTVARRTTEASHSVTQNCNHGASYARSSLMKLCFHVLGES